MTDQPSSSGPFGEENRPRKGRTIDLEATEIKNADAQPEAPSDAQAATSAAVEGAPEAAVESPQRQTADASAAPPLRTHVGWKALIAGGLSGAVIAAASVMGGLFVFRNTDLRELDARLSRVEAQLKEARSGDRGIVESLANRVGKLEATIAKLGSTPVDVASADRFSALETDLKALSARVDTVAQQTEGAAGAAREARQRSEADAAALAGLANKLAGADDKAARDKVDAEVGSLANRVGAVEATLSKGRDVSVRLAVAAIALNSTIERGQPFASELGAVKSLGADPDLLVPLAPFAESGIPSQAALGGELLALLPSLRAIEPKHGSFFTRLQAHAENLVHIRPQQEKAGTEVSAILDRIEIKAVHGDLGGAVAGLDELPPAVRAPAEAWITKEKARSAAARSSQRLLAAALTGLGK